MATGRSGGYSNACGETGHGRGTKFTKATKITKDKNCFFVFFVNFVIFVAAAVGRHSASKLDVVTIIMSAQV